MVWITWALAPRLASFGTTSLRIPSDLQGIPLRAQSGLPVGFGALGATAKGGTVSAAKKNQVDQRRTLGGGGRARRTVWHRAPGQIGRTWLGRHAALPQTRCSGMQPTSEQQLLLSAGPGQSAARALRCLAHPAAAACHRRERSLQSLRHPPTARPSVRTTLVSTRQVEAIRRTTLLRIVWRFWSWPHGDRVLELRGQLGLRPLASARSNARRRYLYQAQEH